MRTTKNVKKLMAFLIAAAMMIECMAVGAFAETGGTGYSFFISYEGLSSGGASYASVTHELSDVPYYVIPENGDTEVDGLQFLGFYCEKSGTLYQIGESVALEDFELREDGYYITLEARFARAELPDVTYTDMVRYDVNINIVSPDDPDNQNVVKTFSESFDTLEGAAVEQSTIRQLTNYYRFFTPSGFKSVRTGHVFEMEKDFKVEDLPEPKYTGVELEEVSETEGNRVTVYEVNDYLVPLFGLYGATGTFFEKVLDCEIIYYMEALTDEEETEVSWTTIGTENVKCSLEEAFSDIPLELTAKLPDYMEALGYKLDGYGNLTDTEITYPEGEVFLDQYSALYGDGELSFAIRLFYSKVNEDASDEEILADAKAKLSAKYQNMLLDEELSDGMKAVAKKAVEAIMAAESKEEIVSISREFVDEFALQERKDAACLEVKALTPEDASDEIMEAVADGIKAINECDSADNFESIIDAVRNEISEIKEAEASLKAAKAAAKPVITKATVEMKGVHLYWDAVDGADGYVVYRVEKSGALTELGTATGTDYLDQLKTTGTYKYVVKTCIGDMISDPSATKSASFVPTPTIASRSNTSSGIKLTWYKITGATGYAIYRWDEDTNGAWERVATIESADTLSWIDTESRLHNGTVFHYTIRALGGEDRKILSGCDKTGRTMVRLFTPTVSSVEKASAKSVSAKWNYNDKCSGYEMRVMSGTTVISSHYFDGTRSLTGTLSGLTAGTTYQVQVRSLLKTESNGTYYSAWSKKIDITL